MHPLLPLWSAGGLRPDNLGDAIAQARPYGLDLCTGVRTDGQLNSAKLAAFMAAALAAVGPYRSPAR